MNEYIVQMVPMVGIAGALVAWLAQIPKTNRGYGFMPDMAVGIVGATVLLGAQRRLWPAAVARA